MKCAHFDDIKPNNKTDFIKLVTENIKNGLIIQNNRSN